MRSFAGRAALATGAALGAYLLLIRPRILSWGATPGEVAEELPGEELVPNARVRSTRAVTIDAPCEAVWPWLNQIGQDRGGLYSSTALQNAAGLRFRNADRVHPEWQLQVGDLVRLVPAERGDFGFTVARSEPPTLLVLGAGPQPTPDAGGMVPVWIFSLRPTRSGGTRLVVRFRSDYPPTLMARLGNQWLLEPVHFLMEFGMLRGLTRRVEAASRSSS